MNAGDKVPLLSLRFDRAAFFDDTRVTLTVYVFWVVPSGAVVTIEMALLPTNKGIAPDAVPDATDVPLTFMVGALLSAVGVAVIEVVALVTLAV